MQKSQYNEKYIPQMAITPKAMAGVREAQTFNEEMKALRKPTALQIAEQRHKSRTEEQIESIKTAWNYRQRTIKIANQYINELSGISGFDTTSLQEAYNKAQWDNVRNEALKLAKQKRTIIEESITLKDYFNGISDVDINDIATALKQGDISELTIQNQLLNAIKKAETDLSDIIPEVHEWHKSVTLQELQQVHSAVESKLAQWNTLTLEKQASNLDFEANVFLANNMHNVQAKFPKTWKISQAAYQKKLGEVKNAIAINEVKTQLDAVAQWSLQHPKSTKVANLLTDAKEALANGEPLSVIKQKADLATAEHQKRLAEQAKRTVKKLPKSSQFKPEDYTQDRKDNAVWAKNANQSMKELYTGKADKILDALPQDEVTAYYEYTRGSGFMNRPLRGYEGSWSYYKGIGKVSLDHERANATKMINDLTNAIAKSSYDMDIWVQRGIETSSGICSFLGINKTSEITPSLIGKVVKDTGFVSCGAAKGTGFSGYILNIYCPKGTKMLYIDGRSHYEHENEMLLQRSTSFRITKVNGKYIDVEVVNQDF